MVDVVVMKAGQADHFIFFMAIDSVEGDLPAFD